MRSYKPPRIRCGKPCYYGGLSPARKHSRAELGVMWHCNRPVKNYGDHCYQHGGPIESPAVSVPSNTVSNHG